MTNQNLTFVVSYTGRPSYIVRAPNAGMAQHKAVALYSGVQRANVFAISVRLATPADLPPDYTP